MTQLTYPDFRRAVVLSDFGEADKLSIRDIPMPTFRPDEMLVRVKATSVNPIEWKMRRGLGLPKPVWRMLIGRPMILGIDFSGTVVAKGSNVTGYQIGDDVMGAFRLWGADAEYVVVRLRSRHTAVALKPSSVSYAEAGAVSFAGLLAFAGMSTHSRLTTKANARVLVIGASGESAIWQFRLPSAPWEPRLLSVCAAARTRSLCGNPVPTKSSHTTGHHWKVC